MAGGSKLGSIYVELSLDDKIYKQKLASMPADAQATTKGLETSWRSLGVKTNQYFDDSRKAAENAYKLIEKSGKYTEEELARAKKAASEKINQLNEQQFGKETSLLTTLKSHYVAVTAAIAVAVGAISKAWELAKAGADYKEQEGILDNLARKYDTTAGDIVDAMEEASDGLVSRADLMNIALGGLAKGLDPTQMTKLADAALLLGDTVGLNATDALNQLTTALETGRTKGLKLFLGSAIDLEAEFGELYSSMTEADKATALYNITIMQAQKLQAQMTGEVSDAGDKIESLEAKYANLKTTVSVFAMQTMVSLYDAVVNMKQVFADIDWFSITPTSYIERQKQSNDAAREKNEILGGMVQVGNEVMTMEEASLAQQKRDLEAKRASEKAIKDKKKALEDAAKEAKKLAEENTKRVEKALEEEIKLQKQFYETNTKLETETEEAYRAVEKTYDSAYDKEIKRIGDQAAKYEDAGADRVTLAKWVVAQISKAEEDRSKAEIKLWQKEEDKWVELMKSEIDEGVKKTDKTLDRLDKEEQAAKDLADKRSSAMQSMYKNLEGYEGAYYDIMKGMVDKQKNDYIKLGVDKVAAEKWATNQLELLDIEKGKSSDDFFDGIKAGYEEAKKNAKGFGDYGYEIFKTFAESSKTAISTTLFDYIKTGSADIKTIWTTFTDSMLKSFTDSIGDMVSKAAQSLIKMTFDAVWNAGASVVIGAIGKLLNYFFDAGFAYGGPVKGYASGGDSPAFDTVPALLSPGEYVMPRSAVNSQTIPHLEYMRQNKRPRGFAGGGYVDEDSPYADVYKYAGMEYRDGSWNAFKITGWDEALEEWIKTYTPISDPISYAGEYLNKTFGYGLQDEAGGTVGQDDYEYLIKWWGSTIAGIESMLGYGEGFDDRHFDQFRVSPTTGSKNPNVVWVEPEDNGYRWYMRDGSNYWTDPSESNWAKRFMPTIIKGISAVMAAWMGAVAGAYIAAGGTIGVGGVTGGSALSSGMAAGAGSMTASLGAAAGAGTIGGFMSYGENGSVTAALIAALIAGAAGYAGASSGIFDWSRGNIISSVIRLGAKSVLKTLASDTFSISPPNVSMESVEDGGLLDTIIANLKDIAPKTSSVGLSLASGMDYVPYDNFPARLHEGERVLTAQENKASGKAPVFHIYLDGEEIRGRMRIIADKVFVDRASSGIGSMQRVYA